MRGIAAGLIAFGLIAGVVRGAQRAARHAARLPRPPRHHQRRDRHRGASRLGAARRRSVPRAGRVALLRRLALLPRRQGAVGAVRHRRRSGAGDAVADTYDPRRSAGAVERAGPRGVRVQGPGRRGRRRSTSACATTRIRTPRGSCRSARSSRGWTSPTRSTANTARTRAAASAPARQQPMFDGGNAYLDREYPASRSTSHGASDAMNASGSADDARLSLLGPRPAARRAASRSTPEQLNRDLGSSFKSIRETIVHTYAAEWAWHSRWQGTSPTALLPADQFPDLAAVRRAWTEHEAKMRAFVDGLGESGVVAGLRVQAAQRPGGRVAVLADAAARREPRQLPPRPGDDDAPPARRGAGEADGHDRLLPDAGIAVAGGRRASIVLADAVRDRRGGGARHGVAGRRAVDGCRVRRVFRLARRSLGDEAAAVGAGRRRSGRGACTVFCW